MRRRMTARTRAAARYAVALVGVAVPLGAFGVAPAAAGVTHVESRHVALIPQAGPLPAQGPNGIMPTSSTVAGRPSESFSRFSFANVSLPDVTSAKLAQFDTV